MDAHKDSVKGLSSIQGLKQPGELITRGLENQNFLITVAFDCPEFNIYTY